MPAPSPPRIALFRGMNLGHRGSPDRAQLEAAFLAAGASNVRSFQTNGTVLFSSPRRIAETVLLDRVHSHLAAVDGDRPVIVRAMEEVDGAVRSAVWDRHGHDDIYREIISFHDLQAGTTLLEPHESSDNRLIILAIEPRSTLSLVRRIGASIGDPNAVLERHHGGVATSRTRGTLRRLLAAANENSRSRELRT